MLIKRTQDWLAKDAIPLWLENGVDWEGGGFFETLSLHGEPLDEPKRAMVQARQIFSFRIAKDLRFCDHEATCKVIAHGIDFLLKHYSLPSGAFSHSVDRTGKTHQATPDLYAQAFALFGMAHAYAVSPSEALRNRANALVQYLHSERRAPSGGFIELKGNDSKYESNPHMHLFEAALSWMDVDQDPVWRKLADEILELCLNKFIDSSTGILAEHFDAAWNPVKVNGRFVFEPGHQYEWAWLMGRYQKHAGVDLLATRLNLFDRSEKYGVCPTRKMAFDEVWSDLTPKAKTSRFWPQCERIKAAVQLASGATGDQRKRYNRIADEACEALFRFFKVPRKGLWFDRCAESCEFIQQPAKASSFYHIIGALGEYLARAN